MSDDSFDPFAGAAIASTSSTTDPQREIWLAQALGGDEANLAYNESTSLLLTGPLDTARLVEALAQVIARHESLRATLSGDGTTFVVEDAPRVPIERLDLSALEGAARAEALTALHATAVNTPFDLVRGPLARATVVTLGPTSHELVFVAHHVICDGWSFGVLFQELATIYRALVGGRAHGLAPAPRFTDYAAQRVTAATSAEASATERFWLETLTRTPAALDLPTDRPRPATRTFGAARLDRHWDRARLDALRAVGRRVAASSFHTLLALTDVLFQRWSGQSDFVVGIAAAGQNDEGFAGLVGHAVNTLPLRVELEVETPFLDHVKAMKTTMLDAFEHQHASFGALLEKLDLPRDPSRVPLVPVLFNVDPKLPPLVFGEARGVMFGNPRVAESFELFLNIAELEEGARLELTYNTSLFSHETAARWLDQLATLADEVVRAPESPVGQLRVIDAAEEALLATAHGPTRALPDWPSVLRFIEARVDETPDAIAVRDERSARSYRELDDEANHWAHLLRAEGVREETLVGVMVERSIELLVAVLAVWKAGGAYVPLEADQPDARLEAIVESAAPRVLLVSRSLDRAFARALPRVVLESSGTATRRRERVTRTDERARLAYVLHTSGSTGKPKGVMVEHGSLLNFLASMVRDPGLDARDVMVAVTTLSFDIAGLELFGPLVAGGQTVIASRETAMDGRALARLLTTSGATCFQATPATYRLLAEAEFDSHGRTRALVGGEALPADLAGDIARRFGAIFNMYGPTETTVWSTFARVEAGRPISIGRAIDNTTVHVVNSLGSAVPRGAWGELEIGGLGVARGYLGQDELTRERFVVREGARRYRTGDVVRLDAEGQLFYARRSDNQVKVRGFRIELGDIEAALSASPGVAGAAATVREIAPGDTRLLGYVVPRDGALDLEALKRELATRLPPYMLPQHLVTVAALPLTRNGKLDRRALVVPSDLGAASVSHYVAPETQVETELAGIWSELLRVHRVGTRDGFFDLGGHSMLATRMLARIRERLGVELPLRLAFQAQTIELLAAHVEAALVTQRPATRASDDVDELEI